jgi:hypothetical protein
MGIRACVVYSSSFYTEISSVFWYFDTVNTQELESASTQSNSHRHWIDNRFSSNEDRSPLTQSSDTTKGKLLCCMQGKLLHLFMKRGGQLWNRSSCCTSKEKRGTWTRNVEVTYRALRRAFDNLAKSCAVQTLGTKGEATEVFLKMWPKMLAAFLFSWGSLCANIKPLSGP